jgi:hypothetical protein
MKKLWWLNPFDDRISPFAGGVMLVFYYLAGVALIMPPALKLTILWFKLWL